MDAGDSEVLSIRWLCIEYDRGLRSADALSLLSQYILLLCRHKIFIYWKFHQHLWCSNLQHDWQVLLNPRPANFYPDPPQADCSIWKFIWISTQGFFSAIFIQGISKISIWMWIRIISGSCSGTRKIWQRSHLGSIRIGFPKIFQTAYAGIQTTFGNFGCPTSLLLIHVKKICLKMIFVICLKQTEFRWCGITFTELHAHFAIFCPESSLYIRLFYFIAISIFFGL